MTKAEPGHQLRDTLTPTTTEFTPTQFHIQTDTGDNRFFKYQTWNGSFRKEVTLDDGSIVGSYGWVDADGYLRITEYVSDANGYRVTKTEKVKAKDFTFSAHSLLREGTLKIFKEK